MNNAASKMVEGKWDRHNGEFVASVRCGGNGQNYVGRTAMLRSKAKDFCQVTLGPVVVDFGAGDVVLFQVIR